MKKPLFSLRFQSWLAVLMVAALVWVTVACAVPQPSHACCKGDEVGLHKRMPCCLGQSAVQISEQQPDASSPGPEPALLSAQSSLDFDAQRIVSQHSMLASHWVADQSDRYLKLRIFLN